jgi:tetratricopeptide (TPR) repeat protein
MSDPLRFDPARASGPGADQDRDAKIEQLLLTGLDHYFAAEYEQAINVWSRALFLDRSHARARAYIERARSALAERQRESEELLQSGVAAFNRGDSDEARRLLHAALNLGAPTDEALVVLDRLNRLDQKVAAPAPLQRDRARAAQPLRRRWPSSFAVPIAAGLTVAVLAGAFILSGGVPAAWPARLALPAPPAGVTGAPPTAERTLPLPRRGEIAFGRAQTLAAAGRLRDALGALDLVRPTDPQKAEAERLRADIQRRLLSVAALSPR